MNYTELRKKVERGAKFSIDFKKRTLKVNGRMYNVREDTECNPPDGTDAMTHATSLYEVYKHSIPSERSDKCKSYFKALPYEEIDDLHMLYGTRREPARFALEFFLLKMFATNVITWQSEWGSWFWQSPADKDFVILREWVEPQ